MIDDKTIKSLYDGKPTLLEWLKRVEAQLEELKKITNVDTLTANIAEINQKLVVKGNPVAKAIYVHKISWKYTSNTANVFKYYLSTKSTPYSSMLDIFAHLGTTNLTHTEIVEYGGQSAILKFGDAGAVLNGVAIGVTSSGGVNTFAMGSNMFEFVKDEVVGNWDV